MQNNIPNPTVNREKRPQILAKRIRNLIRRKPLNLKLGAKLATYQYEYKALTKES